ncbi:hypothetical protein MLD38_012817 [Melastoma candidum]|uniref:Uncharacterized protein n=1 Tax=Melastoma candidum TaxID=119954 RepID=A0ACB9R767_9MYRT|nr:hypothetical protein MLD38_012817 [Melastoma candidum]
MGNSFKSMQMGVRVTLLRMPIQPLVTPARKERGKKKTIGNQPSLALLPPMDWMDRSIHTYIHRTPQLLILKKMPPLLSSPLLFCLLAFLLLDSF